MGHKPAETKFHLSSSDYGRVLAMFLFVEEEHRKVEDRTIGNFVQEALCGPRGGTGISLSASAARRILSWSLRVPDVCIDESDQVFIDRLEEFLSWNV